jgi:hypothetical protein
MSETGKTHLRSLLSNSRRLPDPYQIRLLRYPAPQHLPFLTSQNPIKEKDEKEDQKQIARGGKLPLLQRLRGPE